MSDDTLDRIGDDLVEGALVTFAGTLTGLYFTDVQLSAQIAAFAWLGDGTGGVTVRFSPLVLRASKELLHEGAFVSIAGRVERINEALQLVAWAVGER